MNPTYHNLLPERLDEELAAASEVNYVVIQLATATDEELAGLSERLNFVVINGAVFLGRQIELQERMTHPVLCDGRPVEAAGEVEIVALGGTARMAFDLNLQSGHYRPPEAAIDVAFGAFEACGFEVILEGLAP